MASQSEKHLKELLSQIPPHTEVVTLLRQLGTQEAHVFDRAVAIIGATLVEHGLKIAILGSFIRLGNNDISRLFDFGGNAPLSSLGTAFC
jgi:hypothetical protein